MTNQEIFELISRFESSSIRTIRLTKSDFSLEMSKEGAPSAPQTVAPVAMPSSVPAGSDAGFSGAASITAPLAGMFYAASEPGAAPYVAVGDRVKAGQTVCLMEAMKMISEIPAPCDCIITAILKENGTLAAYDEPLFRYQPC